MKTVLFAWLVLMLIVGCRTPATTTTNAQYVKTHNCTFKLHRDGHISVIGGKETWETGYSVYSCPAADITIVCDGEE